MSDVSETQVAADEAATVTLVSPRAFTLNTDPHHNIKVVQGSNPDFPANLVEHWFVKAHGAFAQKSAEEPAKAEEPEKVEKPVKQPKAVKETPASAPWAAKPAEEPAKAE